MSLLSWKRKQQSISEEDGELENPYFDVQAEMGTTVHGGSLKATKDLVQLCHINEESYILDVGCGVGITACYLAKEYGCKVLAIDISERMIDRAKERAKRKGAEDKIEFRLGDAQNLPFNDDLFDVVISESVTAFVADKQGAVNEYVRVTKPDGYIGLNEITWLEADPTEELVGGISRIGIKPETADYWKEILVKSELRDVGAVVERTRPITLVGQLKRLGFWESVRVVYQSLSMFARLPKYRRAIKKFRTERRSRPENQKNMQAYVGYGIYTGRK